MIRKELFEKIGGFDSSYFMFHEDIDLAWPVWLSGYRIEALKEAVANGVKVELYAPGLGSPETDGQEFVEGPHYPEPHRWYAEVEMQNGFVVKVK